MLLLLLVCTVWSSVLPKAVPTHTRQLWVQRGYELFALKVVLWGLEVCVCMCVYVFVIFVGFVIFFPSRRREEPCVKCLGIFNTLTT